MSDQKPNDSRRRFLKLNAMTLATLPVTALVLGGTVSRKAFAADAERLSESDPQAKALHYVKDASQSNQRQAADHFCHNCLHFQGKSGDDWGPCNIFGGRLVHRKGWCAAWAKQG